MLLVSVSLCAVRTPGFKWGNWFGCYNMNSRKWNKDDINQDLSNISSARYNSGILSQQWQCLVSSILPPNTTIFLYLFILNNMQAIWVFQYSIMVTKFIRHSTFIRQYWNLAFYQGEIFQLFFSSLCPKSTIVDSHKSPKTLRKLHTASLSAVLNHKNVPRLLHTSGTWPDDGRDYNWYLKWFTCAPVHYHIILRDL